MLLQIEIDFRKQQDSVSREYSFGDTSTSADPSVDAVDLSFVGDLTLFVAKH
jgi:hypothetical protein